MSANLDRLKQETEKYCHDGYRADNFAPANACLSWMKKSKYLINQPTENLSKHIRRYIKSAFLRRDIRKESDDIAINED